MISPEEWMDIKLLHRQGVSKRQIAAMTGHSRNTIDRALNDPAPQTFKRPDRQSKLDPFKPYLKERLKLVSLSSVRLLEEIQAQGYEGSLDVVQRFVKALREQQLAAAKATVRFETPPGQQAQADWAHVGKDAAGKIYAFIMVLGFSRTLFHCYTRSMDTATLIACHVEAFEFFGGVPAAILYDNMSQVKRLDGAPNALFADFAAHYGFLVKTHRVRRPRTKGKVERTVDYLKDNFLTGRTFAGIDDLDAQGAVWQEKANSRVHATTGQRPIDLLPKEKLAPIDGIPPYVIANRQERSVDAEGYVRFGNVRYSVPPEHVGKRVVVALAEQKITVHLGDAIIAEHRQAAPGACVSCKEHVDAMWRQSIERTKAPTHPAVFTCPEAVSTPPLSLYEEIAR